MTAPIEPIVFPPGAAPTIPGLRGGVSLRFLRGPETRDAYALTEGTALPGSAGAPPHIHHEGEEAFYVLEGELRFAMAGNGVLVPAGGFVLVPRGTVHAFHNPGARPARYLVIYSPPHVGAYFDELAELAARSPTTPLTPEIIAAVARRYGTEYL